jgi:hypothetical protein
MSVVYRQQGAWRFIGGYDALNLYLNYLIARTLPTGHQNISTQAILAENSAYTPTPSGFTRLVEKALLVDPVKKADEAIAERGLSSLPQSAHRDRAEDLVMAPTGSG